PAAKPLPLIVTVVPPSVVPDPGFTPATCSPLDGLLGFLPQDDSITHAVRISPAAPVLPAANRRHRPLTVGPRLAAAAFCVSLGETGQSIIDEPPREHVWPNGVKS